jgi:hypothetical protein
LLSGPVLPWDGWDYQSGSAVEIEKGNLVRRGESISIYDYETGEYHYVDIESIESNGGGATVEIYDHEKGEHRILEME